MRNKILSIFFVVCMLPTTASNKSFETAILRSIYIHNGEIQSARKSLESDILSLKAENNLSDPDIELEYMFPKEGSEYELTVSEEIQWPGVYSVRNKYINHSITASEYAFDSQALQILWEAKLLLIDLANVNTRIKLQQQLYNKEKELLDCYMAGEKSGAFSILDINKLKFSLFDIKAELNNLNAQKLVILKELKVKNGGQDFVQTGIDSLDYEETTVLKDVSFYIDEYRQFSPENQIRRQQEIANEHAIKISKMSSLPNFSIGYKRQGNGNVHANGFVFGISVPLFSNRHKQKAAKATANADIYGNMDAELKAISSIYADYADLIEKKKLLDEYSQLVNDANNYDVLKKAYESGYLPLSNYLMELQFMIQASLKLNELRYNYLQKLASLNKYQLVQDVFSENVPSR